MKKIVFIVNSIQIQRVVKRINSFYDAGYHIEVYAFERVGDDACPLKAKFEYKVIGKFPNQLPYWKRLSLMRRSIKRVSLDINNQDVLLYFFGLDVALISRNVFHKPYVYEEADLVHTYMSNGIIRRLLELKDQSIIRKSRLTVLTSEGFVNYHFGDICPGNVLVISNKLNPAILNIDRIDKKPIEINHLRFGFVGSFRFESIINFCKVFTEHFPQHQFHVYGTMPEDSPARVLLKEPNFFFHGPFLNPQDLPHIYSNIDISLSTYDATTENARYAEPNKMYESMFFDTPIIVSKNTFLEKKVNNMGIGYAINALDNNEIISFINSLTVDSIKSRESNLHQIDKLTAVNDPTLLFKRIESIV